MDITGLKSVFGFASGVLERIFPDPKDRLVATQKLEEMRLNGELTILATEASLLKGQQEINKIEAASKDKFSSRWRPFIGWVCGVAFAYHFIVRPIMEFILAMQGIKIDLPIFDMTALNTVLMGLLGLGGLRTFEKTKSKRKD